MPRQITIFTGSFKPPHKGHLELVKKMLKETAKPRKGDKGPGYVYIFISKKPRDPCSGITGLVSKQVWQEYLKTLDEKDRSRVKLVLSALPSPTQTAYGFAKRISAPGDLFFLIKSAKNATNTRYASFKTLKGKSRYKTLILPGFESLHSKNMRIALQQGKRSEFFKFLPSSMRKEQKLKIWKKLKILCPRNDNR